MINKVTWQYFGMNNDTGCPQLVCHVSLVTTRTFGFTQLLQRLLTQEKKTLQIIEGETLDTVESMEEEITLVENVTSSLSHNPITETITLSDTTTGHKNYGEDYVLGPWTAGFPRDTVGSKKRLFIFDGSPLG